MKNRRNSSGLSLPRLSALLTIIVLLLLTALSVVVNKNRITALADQQRLVEQETRLLKFEITNLDNKIGTQLLDKKRVSGVLVDKALQLQEINKDARSVIYLKSASIPVAQNSSPQ